MKTLAEIFNGLTDCFSWFDDNTEWIDSLKREDGKVQILRAYDLLQELQSYADINTVTIQNKDEIENLLNALKNEKVSMLRQIYRLKNEVENQKFQREYDRQNRR